MFNDIVLLMKTWDPTRARQLEKTRGLTRKYIASRCKITRQYLNEVLTGKLPSDTLLVVLATTLGTNADYLTGKSDDPRSTSEVA